MCEPPPPCAWRHLWTAPKWLCGNGKCPTLIIFFFATKQNTLSKICRGDSGTQVSPSKNFKRRRSRAFWPVNFFVILNICPFSLKIMKIEKCSYDFLKEDEKVSKNPKFHIFSMIGWYFILKTIKNGSTI